MNNYIERTFEQFKEIYSKKPQLKRVKPRRPQSVDISLSAGYFDLKPDIENETNKNSAAVPSTTKVSVDRLTTF